MAYPVEMKEQYSIYKTEIESATKKWGKMWIPE